MDVPFQSVCSGKLCKDTGQSGSDPVQLFRLWTGCRHNRSGCNDILKIQVRSIPLKIDEVNNLGAARIRVRSLQLLSVSEKKQEKRTSSSAVLSSVSRIYKGNAKELHNSLPSDVTDPFRLLEPAFNSSGYNIEVLPNDNKQAVDVGLKICK